MSTLRVSKRLMIFQGHKIIFGIVHPDVNLQ